MESIVYAPANRGQLGAGQLSALLPLADQVVTLAGLFGYSEVDTAARSLCDVVDGLLRAGMNDLRPVAVHVQALHMMAPTAQALPVESRSTILTELSKVVAHYNFDSLGAAAADDALPGIAAAE